MIDREGHKDLVRDTIAGIKAMGIVFYNTRVAVVRDPAEDKTKGGIYLPDQAQRKESRGTVVGVGIGVDTDDEHTVIAGMLPGDRVMYTKYNPIEFRITLPDGKDVPIELLHISDLYVGWRE